MSYEIRNEIENIPEVTDFGARILTDELWERAKFFLEKNNKMFGIPLYHSPMNPDCRIRGRKVVNALWGGHSLGYLVKESEYPEFLEK